MVILTSCSHAGPVVPPSDSGSSASGDRSDSGIISVIVSSGASTSGATSSGALIPTVSDPVSAFSLSVSGHTLGFSVPRGWGSAGVPELSTPHEDVHGRYVDLPGCHDCFLDDEQSDISAAVLVTAVFPRYPYASASGGTLAFLTVDSYPAKFQDDPPRDFGMNFLASDKQKIIDPLLRIFADRSLDRFELDRHLHGAWWGNTNAVSIK
jgi:hypothetical protein